MKRLVIYIEKTILSIKHYTGIKYPHSAIIIFLLIIIIGQVTYILLPSMSTFNEIKNNLIGLFKFILAVVFTGVIIGIISNRFYDNYKISHKDPIRQTMNNSGMTGFFLPDNEAEKQRRTELTRERVATMKGEVFLLGIAATSYLPRWDNATAFSEEFINKIMSNDISLRLILLNPYSKATKFRYAREEGIDVDYASTRDKERFEGSAIYNDIITTLNKVGELKKKGARIECKITNFEPSISLMLTEEFVYVDILSLGRYEESSRSMKQRSTLPIMEFSSGSPYYRVAKSHFEYHWKYGMTPDELDFYTPALREDFFKTSFTGYQLIKQHDSWISIDPVVGCSAQCKYCVLRTTFQNNTVPSLCTDPDVIGARIRDSKFFKKDAILCLFNYTDALLYQNRDYLVRCLQVLKDMHFKNWICIPTKHHVDNNFLDKILKAYHKDRLIFLISISGLSNAYEPTINKKSLLDSMKVLNKEKVPIIHYWRPVTNANSSDKDIKTLLSDVVGFANCSVVAGLKASKALNQYYRDDLLISADEEKDHGDYLPKDIMNRINSNLRVIDKNYSVYLHTSCAVSSIISNTPDYNGSFFRHDICPIYSTGSSLCNKNQITICRNYRDYLDNNFKDEDCRKSILQVLPMMRVEIENKQIELVDPVYQDDLIYLIQKLKRPIIANKILYTNQYVGSVLS